MKSDMAGTMTPRILLVNPPIHDFTAYDFWIKPYGLLGAAGQLRGRAEFLLFDYLNRRFFRTEVTKRLRLDHWGRGEMPWEFLNRPACLGDIPRYFRRFGLPRGLFQQWLREQGPFDYVLIQTIMTYWYLGVKEVIEDIRRLQPSAKIVLGGTYVTLCPDHAGTLETDLCVIGSELEPLYRLVGVEPDLDAPALWDAYGQLDIGVLKLSDGCPFRCTYCSVPAVYGRFQMRPRDRVLAELDLLARCGVKNVAFYDDALLFDAENVLIPFLDQVVERNLHMNLHTPNALNVRFLTAELAKRMVRAGFKTFYLGFESHSRQWQHGTGGKVYSEELTEAVQHLIRAGADAADITAYQILGHPDSDVQDLESSMYFVRSLGIRGMLADFSPIPGTPDGEACRQWVDLDEPLMHNNTAFPVIRLGFDEVNRLKDLQRRLNRSHFCPGPV
jgi:hypothetical protein